MKKLLLLVCTCLTLTAQNVDKIVQIDGVNRDYRIHLPINYDYNAQMPAVLILHGLGGDIPNMQGTGFDVIADTAGFIPVYLQGLDNLLGNSAWNNGTLLSSDGSDIEFISNVIDTLIMNYGADHTRIYCTGFSMGGIMSYSAACELSYKIAAVASAGGPIATSAKNNCNINRTMPVLHLHGSDDQTVPYASSPLPSLELVPSSMMHWVNNNGCDLQGDTTTMPDLFADGYVVKKVNWNNCTDNAATQLFIVDSADHVWLGPTNDIFYTTEIWKFFKHKSNADAPANGIEESLAKKIKLYPNPSTGIINLDTELAIDEMHLYNLQGQMIRSLKTTELIDLSQVDKGYYLLQIKINQQILTYQIQKI